MTDVAKLGGGAGALEVKLYLAISQIWRLIDALSIIEGLSLLAGLGFVDGQG